MCIPLSGHRSDCCTVWELVCFVCLCCGFCSPHLESFRLLVCVICIKLMKEVSVKTQVFVKPFLTHRLFDSLGSAAWGSCRKGMGNLPADQFVQQRGVAVPFLKWVLGCRPEVMKKSLAKVLRENRKKCFFTWPRTSGFGVYFLLGFSPEFRPVDQSPLHRLIEMEMVLPCCCGMQIILGMFLGLEAF